MVRFDRTMVGGCSVLSPGAVRLELSLKAKFANVLRYMPSVMLSNRCIDGCKTVLYNFLIDVKRYWIFHAFIFSCLLC